MVSGMGFPVIENYYTTRKIWTVNRLLKVGATQCVAPTRSSKPSGDVIFGAFLFGHSEDRLALPVFDQFPLQKEGREIGGARRLLDGVRHEHDGVLLFELLQAGLHLAGG